MARAAFPSGRWRGRWIWCETPKLELRPSTPIPVSRLDVEASRRFGAFRRTFDLNEVPASVAARVTADSRYILWVNGAELARGPIRSHAAKLHYDTIDLAPALRRGRNVIAVLARFYGRATPWWMPARAVGQLGGGALVFEADLGAERWLISNSTWRALPIDGWTAAARRGVGGWSAECIDGRRVPYGWQEPGYDDSDAAGWSAAVELAAFHVGFQGRNEPPSQVYGAMLPRPISFLASRHRAPIASSVAIADDCGEKAHPVDQVASDAAAAAADQGSSGGAAPIELVAQAGKVHVVRFDFGEVVCGNVILDLEAPAGTRIDLSASEFVDPAAEPGGEHMQLGMRYTARGVADRAESFDPIGFRYATLSVRSDRPVRMRPPIVNERLYPRPDGASFECGDEILNRVWKAGRRTVDLNSHDAYLDCPTREQRAWTGDFVVHQMVDLVSNPDWGLARHQVELAASPRADGMLPMAVAGDIEHQNAAYIPDWALHWVRALHNVHRYTADRDLVGRMLPVAENVLRWFVPYLGEDGLLADVDGWVLIDWSAVSVGGRSSALNALWARALLDFAETSEWMGDDARARWARGLWSTVRQGFEAFWDSTRATYVDVIADGRRPSPISQHAPAAAICARLVPDERLAGLVELLTDRSRLVHAAWSVPGGDARRPAPGEGGIGGAYLVLGPPEPWWNVQRDVVAAQPFFRYVVHDALALAGRADLITAQCLDWQELLERAATTLSETWFGGTTCHGWSATPTRDLLVYTLGITPAEPGYARARIAPRLGALEWARGKVPTPHGWLSVEATRERVVVDSPVPFEIDLPERPIENRAAGKWKL